MKKMPIALLLILALLTAAAAPTDDTGILMISDPAKDLYTCACNDHAYIEPLYAGRCILCATLPNICTDSGSTEFTYIHCA